MQKSVNNNDDNHIKNTSHCSQQVNSGDSVSPPFIQPNNSIRFTFPERPPQQNYYHIRPFRTATLNSLKLNPSHHYGPQHYPSRHHSQHTFWADFPLFIASFFSVVGTFLCVRAIVVHGYLVDHSSWNGKGHYYDQHPLVSLNTFETLMMLISLFCGLSVCAMVVLKTRVYHNAVSGYCLIGALIQASSSLTTTFLFYARTLNLVEASVDIVYSRGFYCCGISGAVMLISVFGFFLDWLLDSPSNGPLSVILTAMLLPSVMYCCTLSIGAFSFMWIEGWEYSQAMMFCATALTTIGYGDVAPITPLGRLFFLIYTTLGICVVGYFLLSLRAVMINGSSFNLMMKVNLMRAESLHNYARHQRQRDSQRHRLEQHQHQHQQQQQQQHGYARDDVLARNGPSLPMINPLNDDDDDDDDDSPIAVSTPHDPLRPHQLARHRSTDVISTFSNYTLANILKEENRQIWVHVITHSGVWRMSVIFTFSWFGGAAVFCLLEENWSYLDALYFAFATQLTIGFGDLVPQTMIAQEFWFVYIIISIAVAAYFICLFGDVLAEKLLIDDENDSDSSTVDDGDDGFSEYDINRNKATGEMVEDNDSYRPDLVSTTLSQCFINNNDTSINTTVDPSFSDDQQNTSTPINLRQQNLPYDDSSMTISPYESPVSRRMINTPQRQQVQHLHHQPLQHRTNSLPIISVDHHQKRHTYGSLLQPGKDAHGLNKKV
ncbi:unnamed protein product [Absidia cylindrospora]